MSTVNRKNPRLQDFDYSTSAAYHVIFCTRDRVKLLGDVVRLPEPEGGYGVVLSAIGQCVSEGIETAEQRYPGVVVTTRSIMPNHVHLLVSLHEGECGSGLGAFVRCAKSAATRFARKMSPGIDLWQPRYYDHIIRGDKDFDRTAEYIINNPAKWVEDRYYVE